MSAEPKSDRNDGGPAFPGTWWDNDSTGYINPRQFYPGMSFRAWVASQALAGYRAFDGISSSGCVAERCVQDADALLAELAK